MKQSMDTKMNSIDQALTRIRNVSNLARMYRNGSALKIIRPSQLTNKGTGKAEGLSYSPDFFVNYSFLDLILDINAEMKEGLPQRNGRDIVRNSKIRINSENLSESCKDIDVVLTSSQNLSEDKQSVIGENLTYAIRSCGTNGETLPIFEVKYKNENKSFAFKIFSENNNKILKSALIQSRMIKDGQCEVSFDGNNINKFFCSNIMINLGKSMNLEMGEQYAGVEVNESIVLNHVLFSNSDETKVEIRGNIYDVLPPWTGYHVNSESNQENQWMHQKGTISFKLDQKDRLRDLNIQKSDSSLKFDPTEGKFIN